MIYKMGDNLLAVVVSKKGVFVDLLVNVVVSKDRFAATNYSS